MSDIAIRVEGLSKLYRLGATERYRTLRDTLTDTFMAPFRRLRRGASPCEEAETLWALKDVSFEVKHGEVIGIIGRNGAGKSTLLKILSRITEPTEGRVEINGRVGSLLEVGTGFHPELSGRENIFLNGAILGMKKAEIRRKFDEIVAFAEVERFIDTPVKHYSSGMYVRLAFAVAAHMETEILVVDEVLAVGDLEFQKKCLGKMGDAAKSGRTVILVSHSMASISSLCATAVLLDSGRIAFHGAAEKAVERYIRVDHAAGHGVFEQDKDRRRGTGEIRFIAARSVDYSGQNCRQFNYGEDISIEFTLDGLSNYEKYLVTVHISTITGITVLHLPTPPEFEWPSFDGKTPVTFICKIPNCRLYPGTYLVCLWVGRNEHLEVDWLPDALSFSIEQGSLVRYGFDMSWRHGLYFCDSEWSLAHHGQALTEIPGEPVEAVFRRGG